MTGSLGAFFLLQAAATHSLFAAGATTPFTTLEGETGILGNFAEVKTLPAGALVPTVATMELEASGGAYIELKQAGQSVSWKNPVAGANTIVIRNCIPDAPDGGGIQATLNLYVDGVFRQALDLSSRQCWVYRKAKTNPDDPNAGGMPYHFYNEDRAWITGAPLAQGSTIMLKKDEGNTAAFYNIDCIDLEKVAPPLTQPIGSLSIVDYGADPGFIKDSTEAIKKCFDEARTQNKAAWIPPGKFMVNSLVAGGLDLKGVTVCGAGMWHSMIYRNIPLPPPKLPWRSNIRLGAKSVLRDVSVDSNSIYRSIGGASGDDYGLTASGDGWLIERVWVQHCDAQWLTGSNGMIRDSRVADSWADGINLNNGNRPGPDNKGINLTAQNNFVRGTGDDGIATFSDAGEKRDNWQMDGTKILNNTTVAPWWANGIRVAGGKNVVVQNNLTTDASSNCGLEISVFGESSQPLESALITGNVILRGGGWNTVNRHGVSIGSLKTAPSTITFQDNIIRDSRRAGLNITGWVELICSGNTIDHPAVDGILIGKDVTGNASFLNNKVINLTPPAIAFRNNSSALKISGQGNDWPLP